MGVTRDLVSNLTVLQRKGQEKHGFVGASKQKIPPFVTGATIRRAKPPFQGLYDPLTENSTKGMIAPYFVDNHSSVSK
jgi:hypothetical protein